VIESLQADLISRNSLIFLCTRSHGGFVSPSHHSFTTLRVGTLDVPARNYRTKADPSLLDWVSPGPVTSGVTRPARISPRLRSTETESLRVPAGIELYSPDDVGRARWWSASLRRMFHERLFDI